MPDTRTILVDFNVIFYRPPMPARVINKVTAPLVLVREADNPCDLSLVLMPGATYRDCEGLNTLRRRIRSHSGTRGTHIRTRRRRRRRRARRRTWAYRTPDSTGAARGNPRGNLEII